MWQAIMNALNGIIWFNYLKHDGNFLAIAITITTLLALCILVMMLEARPAGRSVFRPLKSQKPSQRPRWMTHNQTQTLIGF
jgi:hypothetical protein